MSGNNRHSSAFISYHKQIVGVVKFSFNELSLGYKNKHNYRQLFQLIKLSI